MKSRIWKLCSMIVVLALLIQLLPMQILGAELSELLESTAAEEITTEGSAVETAEVLTEVTERRTEYTKEFKLSNGLSMAVVYPQAVHYEENGQWKEIDNTLISAENSLKGGIYQYSRSLAGEFPPGHVRQQCRVHHEGRLYPAILHERPAACLRRRGAHDRLCGK